MELSQDEILQLKNNSSFINELNNREREAKEEKDIIKLYEVLDSLLVLEQHEQVNKIYSAILEISLELLHSKLKTEELFDLDNEKDHYSLRAIYEYGIEQYRFNRFHEAKELFIMLSILTNSPIFRGAMQIHLVAILKEIPFDEFIEKFVDMEKMKSTNESFFILYFYDNANQFLHENSQLIRDAIIEVKNIKI